MPRNGSGTYSPPAGTAAVSLQPIASVPYNNFLTDISSEMTNSLPTTGVKAMGANLPMGGNKIINMADGSASTDGATMNNVNLTHGKLLAIQVFNASGTYTKTPGAVTAIVLVQAGGGAGGGAVVTTSGNVSLGGHGGSGSWSFLYNWTIVSPQTVTIGAGGIGGAGNGGTGGATTFGAIVSTSGGGGGGFIGSTAIASAATAPCGLGGAVATGGTVNSTGQSGGNPFLLNSTAFTGSGGAPSSCGGGAAGRNGAAAGIAAVSPGSGGGGGLSSASAAVNGGNGAAGIVIVWEYS